MDHTSAELGAALRAVGGVASDHAGAVDAGEYKPSWQGFLPLTTDAHNVPGRKLTTVEAVHDAGSYRFTAADGYGVEQEVVVVPCTGSDDDGDDSGDGGGDDAPPVAAWLNRCTHEPQRFDTGRGVPMRDGELICPRHGSTFDACNGGCDNGDAAGTTLPGVEIRVVGGDVYLVDDGYEFRHEGGVDDGDGGDGDDGPSSTSHLSF